MLACDILKILRPAMDFNIATIRQYAVLMQVYDWKKPREVRDISRALRLSKPAVSRALDVLASDHHFIDRLRSDEDGRLVFIKLTEAGKQFCKTVEGL